MSMIMAAMMAISPMNGAATMPSYVPDMTAATTSDFYKKRYRDRRVRSNERLWRDNRGRWRCKRDNGTTGLVIGGVVGGVAGHEIAGRGDKTLGTIIGAGVGAIAGREIDRGSARCR